MFERLHQIGNVSGNSGYLRDDFLSGSGGGKFVSLVMVSFCKNGRFSAINAISNKGISYLQCLYMFLFLLVCYFLIPALFATLYYVFSRVFIRVNYSILSTLPNIVYYIFVWGRFDNICVWVLLSSPNMHRVKSR